MHKQGYNYFNINKLTFREIDDLLDAHNMEVNEQKRRAKSREIRNRGKRR